MYLEFNPRKLAAQPVASFTLVSLALLCCFGSPVHAQPQVIRNITQATERMEMTVNTSRILTLDKRIPRMVVNNPELVTVTPISANQVQLAARKPGVTQVNLWDEDDRVYTVDVLIYGDVRELELALQRIFPDSSVKVVRLTNSLVLEGYVERPEIVGPIIRLAEDYAPKIVNNISVGGVQQIMLKVRVMEVSRTKLRNCGFDFAQFGGDGDFVASSISGLIQSISTQGGSTVTSSGSNLRFGVVDGGNSFFGFLDALQQNDLAKTLADPTITTVSGRPAKFVSGGQAPYVIPGGVGQPVQVDWEDFGTMVDFVPIVLGNGNIRLEVRPTVKDLDPSLAIVLQDGTSVPGFRTRSVDTGVELKAGQTLALAGLIQTRTEAQSVGLPYVSDVPYLGALFRNVQETTNEIELLILVTPEFVDGMEPHEVPQCGPGMETVSPNNCQLYFGGHLEVPACGPCAPNGCVTNCATGYNNPQSGGYAISSDAGQDYSPMPAPAGEAYQDGYNTQPVEPPYSEPATEPTYNEPAYSEPDFSEPQPSNVPQTYQQPQSSQEPQYTNPAYGKVGQGQSPQAPAVPAQSPAPTAPLPSAPAATEEPIADPSAIKFPSPWQQSKPIAEYSRQAPQTPTLTQPVRSATSTPGLIGPIGYDMEK